MSLFKKGRAKTGGRRKDARDRIGTMFLEELAKDFNEHGPEVIRLARIERPAEYLKIIAATLCRKNLKSPPALPLPNNTKSRG